jgi:hypothetical protein
MRIEKRRSLNKSSQHQFQRGGRLFRGLSHREQSLFKTAALSLASLSFPPRNGFTQIAKFVTLYVLSGNSIRFFFFFQAGNRSSCYGSSSGSGSGATSRCHYFRSCVQFLAEYERFISGGNISFTDLELDDACK